jgi:2',3'-cyclic-nucleotide 2'-phosphodiesterase (5'-nucleotidase family)
MTSTLAKFPPLRFGEGGRGEGSKRARRWLRLLAWATAGAAVLVISTACLPHASAKDVPVVRLNATLDGDKAQAGEAEVGNLVADAVRAATGADIALVAGGEIRESSVPAGEVSAAQISNLLAYGQDTIVVVPLNGATLLDALKHAVSQYPRKNKGFLQVSGIEFTFTPNGPIQARLAGGSPLQAGKTYRVAMSSTLATGQYGYFRLWRHDRSTGGLTVGQALSNFLGQRPQLNIRLEGRIVAK